MKFKILSVIFLSFFLTTQNVFATENPFTITVTKGTNKATISTISSKTNISGTTSISKSTGLPIKTCTSVFGSDGKTTPCTVDGLLANTTYYVAVSASDSSGNNYLGKQSFTLATPPANPQNPTNPTTPQSSLGVSFSVQNTEKDIKVSIKNNTIDPQYKVTTTFSDADGFNKSQSGSFDNKGETITQSFTGFEPKKTYNVSIDGTPVKQNSAGYITEKYTVYTNFTKPSVVKLSSTTNQTPPIVPDTPNTPNQNTPYVPNNPVTVTTPGTVLTPEQVKADKEGNGLVPCKNTCDFNDVLQLVNNLIVFLIKELFIPIIILLFMYAGYQYITANGNPAKVANLKKMVGHIVLGMLLVLCSWLIVKTLISILSSDTDGVLQFLK